MAIVFFSSLEDADTIDLTFSKTNGGDVVLRMLVDSGFTGRSWFVLPASAKEIVQAPAPASDALGALQGPQTRALVLCHLSALSFHAVGIAILADLGKLDLPAGVAGIVGLSFLRQFHRWGSERAEDGKWSFFLERTIVATPKNGVPS